MANMPKNLITTLPDELEEGLETLSEEENEEE